VKSVNSVRGQADGAALDYSAEALVYDGRVGQYASCEVCSGRLENSVIGKEGYVEPVDRGRITDDYSHAKLCAVEGMCQYRGNQGARRGSVEGYAYEARRARMGTVHESRCHEQACKDENLT